MSHTPTSFRFIVLSFAFFVITFAVSVTNASAATFVVNTTTDTQDALAGDGLCADSSGSCSLRAAITEANALAGADIITLPAGTYTSTLVANNENLNAGGDFDITSDIAIQGAGAATTFVEANAVSGAGTERVFHIRGAATTTTLVVTIDGITARNGGPNTINSFGGGIRIDQGTSHNITLSNSIVTANINGSSGGGISISGSTTPTVNILSSTISNNRAGGSATGHIGFYTNADRTTLAEWKTATGQEVNSLSADPLFVSATDLHIQAASPARNVGTPISVTVDFDGQARPNPFDSVVQVDIGADEFYAPVAAQATLSGRVTTANGAGIRNAIISISGGDLPETRYSRTSSFGYYGFEDLAVGQTYIVSVNSKRYTFTVPTRVIQVNDNVDGVDFIAEQ